MHHARLSTQHTRHKHPNAHPSYTIHTIDTNTIIAPCVQCCTLLAQGLSQGLPGHFAQQLAILGAGDKVPHTIHVQTADLT